MTTQPVQINTANGQLVVRSPYNTYFIERAKRTGGRYQDGDWVFDARDEERVREICMDAYGNDGVRADTCTVRVEFDRDDDAHADSIQLAGRPIAKASGRDSGATLSPGVVILEGGFTSGGSRKNWTTQVKGTRTVVLVRDFPRVKAQLLIDKGEGWIQIEPEAPYVDRDALKLERERLIARLEQIDAILGPEQTELFQAA
jgi:hypothetical protein